MAKQTWDTSRTGGGTYEFTQDAQGNYNLNSVGFQKLNKLNLPELQKEAVTTDTTKTTATASAQTAKAFGDVQPFYYDKKGEGGTGTQYTMRKEGDLSTDIKPMAQLARQPTPEERFVFPYKTPIRSQLEEKDTIPKWAQGADRRGYENIGKKVEPITQVGRQNVDQVLAARKTAADPNRFPGMVGPQKPSPYQDAIMRGETGVKYSKPEIPQVAATTLRNVKTSLKTLANTVGIALNPAVGIGKMLLGTVQDTPTQSHARKYFNTNAQTGRIVTFDPVTGREQNASTSLYAGMNQTSAFGNLERSGERRIETREKTIEQKGYKAGDKFFDDTQNMKNQQKDYKNSKDNNVVDKGFTRTRAERKASPGRQDREGGGGSGNGGGKSIICTQMYQQTQLEDWKKTMQLWYIFQKKYLTIEHQEGYHFLFKPFVNGMKKSKILTTIGKYCAIARTNDIKHIMFGTPFSFVGRLVRLVTEPICYLTGKIKSWL